MNLPLPCETPAARALAATWQRLRQTTGHHVLVVGGLCLAIALLLTALDGRGFGPKLVYSFAIGMACTLIVDLTRLAVAWGSDRVQARRGLPALPNLSGWRGAIPGSLLAMVLGPPLGLAVGDFFTGGRSVSLLNMENAGTRVTLVLSLIGTVFSVAFISTQERLSAARAQAEAAQRQATEHQLRLLQSQLEPHMLFNTLANLRVLIGLEPERAQAMLDRLISFLRATLNASRLDTHPLATEFERINDYLALMAVRMGPRLEVKLDLPTELSGIAVPPLLLQPLVENAIKHGLEPHVQGGRVEVCARADATHLLLTVRDTGSGLVDAPSATQGSRFGLAQVRERLATLHGSAASLNLQAAPDALGGTLATICLPLSPAKP